jgi:hypothetical protein
MARSYGKLTSTIWSDPDFQALPNTATQLLYLALISQPDVSACGRLSVAVNRWTRGMAVERPEEVTEALNALECAGFVWVDYDSDEVVVRTFIKHDNGISNPRRLAAIRNAVTEIASDHLRKRLYNEYPGVLDDTRSVKERDSFDERSPNESRSDSDPYQQATSREQLAAGAGLPPYAQLPAAAAEALEMYVAWRMSSEPTVRNPRRYAERIRKSEYEQHRQSLEDEWFDDPKQVLVSSFGLTPGQALEAAVEYRAVRNDTD